MNARQWCVGLLVLIATVSRTSSQERPSPQMVEGGDVAIKQVMLVDAIGDWKPTVGRKLFWVKLDVTKMSPALKSINIDRISALASDKSVAALYGYYLGESSTPRIEMYGLAPGQVYVSVDSKDSSSTFTNSSGTKTIGINKVPAVLSLTFEVLPKSTLIEIRGFGAKPLAVEKGSTK